jgi:uncharacterized protein (DUF2141 family)
LVVKVDGLRSKDGDVCIIIYGSANAADFPRNSAKAARRLCTKINSATSMQMTIKDLPPGSYAATLLHDSNGDGMPNNEGGIPTEGFGFSQNPPLDIAAPKFDTAAFTVEGPRTTIQIKMNYLQ